MNGNNTAGFGLGLLVGAALGAAIALLYAPQTGRETRAMVRDRAGAVRERARKVIGEVRGKAEAEEEEE